MPPLDNPVYGRGSVLAALRRHPFLVVSLACHVVLLVLLYRAGPYRITQRHDADNRGRVERSLKQTGQREMQRSVHSMEEIKRLLDESNGQPPSPKPDKTGDALPPAPANPEALLAKATLLVRAIEATEQKIKAAELARLLHIPQPQALKQVRAEAAARAKPAGPVPAGLPPEAAIAQLAAQAKAALSRRQQQLADQQHGVAVKGGSGPPGQQHGDPGPGGAGGSGPMGDVTARIDALASGMGMGDPNALRVSSLDMASESFSDARHFGAYLAAPQLDAGKLRAGAGRKFGPGGPYANRVFVNKWYIIGPFQGSSADSLKTVYPPERGVDLDAAYFGKNKRLITWTYQGDAGYPTVPMPRAENAVYYAYTEVDMDRERDLWMSVGADDDAKLWFNDRLVWISGGGDKPWYHAPFYSLRDTVAQLNLTEAQRKLHFNKGRNTILLKLYNGIDLMFFAVVLSSEADSPAAPR